MKRYPLALPLLACSCLVHAGSPIVYCANSAAGVQFSLTVAQDNGLDDDIRIVSGSYALTQMLSYLSNEAHSLTISGGWNVDCSMQDGGATTLDGQGLDQVLRIFTQAVSAIGVSGITFINGHLNLGGSGYASGLSIRSGGEVRVEANRFFLNQSQDDAVAGALKIGVEGSAGRMIVRNNLIAYNMAGGDAAGVLGADAGEQYVTGNTIVGNQATHASTPMTGGLYLADSASADFTLSNNLLWANNGNDLYNANDVTTLVHNDIGVLGGVAPDPASNGNFALEPVFSGGLFNFRPASRSPLINAGTNAPPGGAGLFDIDGALRLQGPRIDIGAYESDVIFYSGFEALP